MENEKYTTFEELYGKFLSKINDYGLATTNSDDFEFILENYLSAALGLYYNGDLTERIKDMNVEEKHFGTKLTLKEQWMLVLAMVYQWTDEQIYERQLMQTAISNRDLSESAPANQLRAMNTIRDTLKAEMHKHDVEYSYIGFDGFS